MRQDYIIIISSSQETLNKNYLSMVRYAIVMAAREIPGFSPELEIERRRVKKPKIHPHFEYLEGLSPMDRLYQERRVYIYELYIGEKTNEMFNKHGVPHPEELGDVRRTLRAVFGGQFSRKINRWEKSHLTGSIPQASEPR